MLSVSGVLLKKRENNNNINNNNYSSIMFISKLYTHCINIFQS